MHGLLIEPVQRCRRAAARREQQRPAEAEQRHGTGRQGAGLGYGRKYSGAGFAWRITGAGLHVGFLKLIYSLSDIRWSFLCVKPRPSFWHGKVARSKEEAVKDRVRVGGRCA